MNVIRYTVVISAFLFSSCSQRLMDFSIVSTKNIELSKFGDYTKGQSRVDGEDKKAIILFIPLGFPSAEEAIDRAIESVPGAVALLDGVVTFKGFGYPGFTVSKCMR